MGNLICCMLVLRVTRVLIVRRKLETDYVDHEMEVQGLGHSDDHEDRLDSLSAFYKITDKGSSRDI